ncbi:polyhomeotic-like protein 1 [Heptranchias perlo]|uniref:polyhomeotic-like protein 1 n=1 Tax=Heptranchias perlo TaxID=212740 RepID=UPI0035595F1E
MYLQTQMPQPGSLLQVARSLTRNVPLAPQLILMPGGTVATVQSDVPAPAPASGLQSDTDQAQNLALRNQQTTAVGSQSCAPNPAPTLTVTQASTLNPSQAAVSQAPVAGKGSGGTQSSGGPQTVVGPQSLSHTNQSEGESNPKKAEMDSTSNTHSCGINLTRSVTPTAGQTLISSACTYTQIQPYPLIHQHLQQKQLLIHHQQHIQHRQSQLMHSSSRLHQAQCQPSPHSQTLVVQAQPQPQACSQLHKQAQAQSQPQACSQLHKQAQAQAQPLACSPAQAQPQACSPAQPLACSPAQAQPQPCSQAQPQACSQAQPCSQPQAHPCSQPQPQACSQPQPQPQPQACSQPQPQPQACSQLQPLKQAPVPLLPKQAIQPIKVQSSSTHLQVAAKFVAQSHPATGGMGSGQVQAQASGCGPGAMLQASASTQTQAIGLVQAPMTGTVHSLSQAQAPAQDQAQAKDQAQPQPQAQASIVNPTPSVFHLQPLPLKTAVVGVKRKAEDEEEKVFTEKLSTSTLDPPQLTPNILTTVQEQKLSPGGKVDMIHSSPPVLTSISTFTAPPLLKVSARHGGEIKPPQAIVKPHILTHVIEGFVIQEGAEPFPVDAVLGPADGKQKQQEPPVLQPETQLGSHQLQREPANQEGSEVLQEMLKCEFCGRLEQAEKFKRSKRFCSMACAKRYNVSCRKGVRRFTAEKMSQLHKESGIRMGRRGTRKSSAENVRVKFHKRHLKNQEESSRASDNSSYDEDLSPVSPSLGQQRQSQSDRDLTSCNTGLPDLMGINPSFLSSNPGLWNVGEVHEFISSLPGCQDLAEEFRSQEIDGQALLLLKEEHLMTAMNMKLGPALKICARINLLKES